MSVSLLKMMTAFLLYSWGSHPVFDTLFSALVALLASWNHSQQLTEPTRSKGSSICLTVKLLNRIASK